MAVAIGPCGPNLASRPISTPDLRSHGPRVRVKRRREKIRKDEVDDEDDEGAELDEDDEHEKHDDGCGCLYGMLHFIPDALGGPVRRSGNELPSTQRQCSIQTEGRSGVKGKVQLSSEVPPLLRAAFASIPELEVATGSDEFVELGGFRRRIRIIPKPSGLSAALETEEPLLPPDTTGIVIARSLTGAERASIEDAGLSWCDSRGAIHLVWPGVYFHVDRERRAPSKAVRQSHPGVGLASIRGIQAMLAEPEAPWTVAQLARAAALSNGQAHNILTTLEANRLMRTEGRGPKQRRFVRDRGETLEWLADIERTRRRPQSVASYLYARTFEDLIDRFADRAESVKLSYALTAGAGATALGHRVLTNPIVLQVRVGHIDPLHALDLLGLAPLEAEDAGRGMNIDLWADVGELGTFAAEAVHRRAVPVRVAPRVRIWLDMIRLGGRDADAAALFKEQAL